MNDNIIVYAISLICIILLLIEWFFISHKKMFKKCHCVCWLFISFVLLNELKRGWWSSIYVVVLFGIIYIYPCNNFIDYIF